FPILSFSQPFSKEPLMSPRSLRTLVLGVVAFVLAPAAYGQGTEKYLPSGSQVFAQADPHEMHAAAYKQTVLGKNLSGELGKCLYAVYKHALLAAELYAAQEKQIPQEKIDLAKKGLSFLEKFDGLSFGLEVSSADPPEGHVVLVLNKMGADLPEYVDKLL